MKDYTTNNCCNFLWISDLLQLKKNASNVFTKEFPSNQKLATITVKNVVIFGTVVEVKQIGCRGYLYQIDDGTGVIACKHSEEQFEELISLIESEQVNFLDETLEFRHNMEQSVLADTSADDSIFNDESIQVDDININKKGRLKGLQSIWNDIYSSFNSLIEQYNIGDSVIIQGRLYSYFSFIQIYVNSIRSMDVAEEIMQLMVKIEDTSSDPHNSEHSKTPSDTEKRFSGLVTFDNIQQLNPTFSVPGNVGTPNVKDNVIKDVGNITPNLESTITFDTFTCKI